MGVVVVGASSLIARALKASAFTSAWRFVSHASALESAGWLHGTDVLVNCAFDPRLKTGAYDAAHDVDLRIAALLRDWPAVHYVMLSSRLAYGPAPGDTRLVESMAAAPDRPYGIAKLATEQALERLLGKRLTVLRLSNVFGDEAQPGRQNFFAIALRTLRDEGRIVLDMSPFVERDFIPVEELAAALVRVAAAPRAGLFNLGAGHGTPTGRIAQWLIEGHGRGEMMVTSMREFDAFSLDIAAATNAFGIEPVTPEVLRERCRRLGERLRVSRQGQP
ncbi:MAG TPA: NAD-dependent epimerase/dehydratase family protein [Albitalea sp.]